MTEAGFCRPSERTLESFASGLELMPVNLLPVLIPVVCAWAALAYILFRWGRRSGWYFLALTSVMIGVWFLNTGVERRHIESMRFEKASDDGTVFLTTDRGETLTVDSRTLAVRLRGREGTAVAATWCGTYDFGRLRAYHFQAVDGVLP